MGDANSAGRADRPAVRRGLVAVLCVAGLFLLTWWNRYLSPTSGGTLVFATEYAHGRLPYRDYFYFGQPGGVYLSVGLTELFGRRLIVLWAFGGLLRLAAAGCMYLWMARLAGPGAAALGALTAFVVGSADVADTPGFYNHVAASLAVVGGYFAGRTDRGSLAGDLLAGALLGSSFLEKHTVGALAAFGAGVGVVAVGWGVGGCWRGVRRGSVLTAGFAVLVGAAAGWLVWHGLWDDYVRQVYLTAPAGKGGLLASLARPAVGTLRHPDLVWGAVFGLLIVGCGWLAVRRVVAVGPGRLWAGGAAGPAGLVAMGVAAGAAATVSLSLRTPLLAAAYATMFGCLLLGGWGLTGLRAGGETAARGWVLPAALGFAVAYSLSISYPAFEVMVIPGLAVLVAAAARTLPAPARPWLAAGCCLLSALAAGAKYRNPHSWGLWAEPPVWAGSVEPRVPELAGFRVGPETAVFYERVTQLIRDHSGPDEAVYVYPHMAMLYALSDRRPASRAIEHVIDVCPDDLAREEATRLTADPPAVLVVLEIPDGAYESMEIMFRDGHRSGQRDLAAAIDDMARRKYRVVGRFEAAGTGCPITVWARGNTGGGLVGGH